MAKNTAKSIEKGDKMPKPIGYAKGTITKGKKKKTFIREFWSDGSVVWHIP